MKVRLAHLQNVTERGNKKRICGEPHLQTAFAVKFVQNIGIKTDLRTFAKSWRLSRSLQMSVWSLNGIGIRCSVKTVHIPPYPIGATTSNALNFVLANTIM